MANEVFLHLFLRGRDERTLANEHKRALVAGVIQKTFDVRIVA